MSDSRDIERAEQGRVKAEAERARAEGQSAIVSGGRREAEDDRQQAERARKKAEEKRQETLAENRRRARRDIILVAAMCLILLGFGLYTLDKIGEASKKSCEDTNVTTLALKRSLERGIESGKDDIRQVKNTNPNLFPQIPEQKLQNLIDKRVDKLQKQQQDRRHDASRLQLIDCEARYS